MKRRHLLLVALGLILTICMCLAVACGKKGGGNDGGNTDPATLSAPVVSIGTDGKATWAEVEHASGYAYKINNGEEKTDATKTGDLYTVQLTDGQAIQVKAKGDGTNYKDSNWSPSKTYTAGSTDNGHTCGHVCTEPGCGKCTDNTCTDPVCSNNRCPGHGSGADTTNYGTLDNPLSISQALALADAECVEDGDFTKQYVYATGKVSNVPTKNSSEAFYRDVTLADLTDSSKSILVYTVNVDTGVAAPAQNDTLVIYGYIKNHQGTIEFAGNGSDYVYIKSNTRGTSTVALGAHEGADVTGLPETKTNGETVEFTVTAQSGRAIDAVTVYGNPATVVDETTGKYSFVVAGNATVVVETRDASTAAAEELITLDFAVGAATQSELVNSYEKSFTATQYGVSWTVANFNNGVDATSNWGHIRTGHKTKTLASSIATDAAWADTVTKVVVKVSALKYADKVTSFRLEVSSDADFTNIVETVTTTIIQGNNEFKIETPVANHYYRIVIDYSPLGNDASGNGITHIDTVTYWGHTAAEGSIKDPDKINEGKVAAAKKALKLNPAEYSTLETGIQLDNTHGEVALTWTVKNTADTEWVVINNNVLDILKLPDADEKEIVINVHLSLGKAEDDKEIVLTLIASNAKGTVGNPYTVAEAVAEAKKLSSTDWSAAVYATGYVIALGNWYTDHWGSVVIADSLTSAKGNDDAIILYNLYPDGTYLNAQADLVLGATITVYGYMKNYQGNTPEFDTNNSLQPKAVAYAGPTDETKVALALKALKNSLNDVTTADDVTLPVSTVAGVTFKWSSSDPTYVVDEAGLVLKVSALPAEETTVTLTVTATCGSVTESSGNNTKTVTVLIKPAGDKSPVTVPVAFSDLATAGDGWETSSGNTVKSAYKDFYLIADKIRFTLTDTDPSNTTSNNSGTWWSSGDMRLYQTGKGCTVTISAETGYKIVSLKFTYSISNGGTLKYKADNQNYATNTLVNVDSTSAVFEVANTGTAKNGQVKLTAIEVVYIPV